MNLWKRAVVVTITFTLLVVGWSSPALNANVPSDPSKQIVKISDGKRIQEITDLAKTVVSNNEVVVHDNGSLDYKKANITDISSSNGIYTIISIPVVGDEYSLVSNLTLIIDKNNKVTKYFETLVTKSVDAKFAIANYNDGKMVHDQVTDINYVDNRELEKEMEYIEGEITVPHGIGKIAACLSTIILIDLIIAKILAATCVSACAIGIVPICAACIGGLFAVGGTNIGGAAVCFNLK